MNSYNVTYDTYMESSVITDFPWDEKMDSMVIDRDYELVYNPNN